MSGQDSQPQPSPEFALDALLDSEHPIKMAAADFARAELSPSDMVERDRDLTFNREGWRRLAEHDVQGMLIPERFGGTNRDLITTMLTLEGIGLGSPDSGLGFALCSQMLCFQNALVRFGTDEQRDRYLPALCDGSTLGAFAITEPATGSDSLALETRAERVGDHYVLNGTKAHMTFAPVADLAIVFANTRPDAGRWGVSAFFVETDRPGVEQTSSQAKMGMRTTPYGDITLTDCEIPVGNLIGSEGSGAAIFAATMHLERGAIFVTQLGGLERFLNATVAYSRDREQSGQPIGDFQAVSHRIVDAKVALETSRMMLYKAVLQIARGDETTMSTAISKLHAGESIAAASLGLARTFGAVGYRTDGEIEREVRDALGGLVYSGTSDIQRNVIARMLGVTR